MRLHSLTWTQSRDRVNSNSILENMGVIFVSTEHYLANEDQDNEVGDTNHFVRLDLNPLAETSHQNMNKELISISLVFRLLMPLIAEVLT